MRFKFYLHECEPGDRRSRELAEQQVERAHKHFLSRGGKWDDPKAPIYQWNVIANAYPSYKIAHEMGRKDAALYAIAAHIKHDVPLPEWAKDAFLKALRDVNNYRVGSWDDVFGKRVKKGQHLAAVRKEHQRATQIYNEISEIHRRGGSIDFEAIGRKFGVGATLVRSTTRISVGFVADRKIYSRGSTNLLGR